MSDTPKTRTIEIGAVVRAYPIGATYLWEYEISDENGRRIGHRWGFASMENAIACCRADWQLEPEVLR